MPSRIAINAASKSRTGQNRRWIGVGPSFAMPPIRASATFMTSKPLPILLVEGDHHLIPRDLRDD
jgi:hypothetical protein